MAHRVSQQMSHRRPGVPLAVLVLFLLGSGVVNVGAMGAMEMLESEPFVPPDEELLIVQLTEPVPPPELELPPPEIEPPQIDPPEREKKDNEFELVEPEPPEPEPEPELPEPELIPEDEPPQEIEPLDNNLKSVEQLDELDDNETNQDADFLSNIDRKVEEQTQSEITNLRQDALEAEASQLEPSDKPEKGTANEELIAETETQRSAKAKEAPKVKPEQEEMRPEQNEEPESLLATRELEALEHSEAMEAADDLAIEADDGVVQLAQAEAATVLPRDQQAKIMRRDPRYQFKLSQNEMDALFGEDQNAPKNVESLKQSKDEGVWDNARAAYQSPLENFVPEVQPGNQTALNSRKHPFARYIAAMHRGIHEAWGFGYLASLDNHPASHPLNDLNLWTRVEIVINGDGTIDKVRTIHHSGNSSFDAAAREVVLATGPYPNPPKSIRSGNGKIYMHWAFHRNERACGTFGASPYILDNAGAGDVPSAHQQVHIHGSGGSHEESVRSLTRNDPEQPPPVGAPGQSPELRRGGEGMGISAAPEGPARPAEPAEPPPGTPAPAPAPSQHARGPSLVGPGSGRGSGGRGGGSGNSGSGNSGSGNSGSGNSGSGNSNTGNGSGSGTAPSSGDAASQPGEGTTTPEGEIDPVAGKIAKNWARAFVKGEIPTLLNRSALPFNSGSRVAARSKDELQGLLEGLSEEVTGKAVEVKGTYTAAGLRRKFGSVPAGIEEGEGKVYTVVEIGGDTVILMLQKRYGSWRVTGMTR